MTLLFLLFVALALAAGFVIMVMQDPGYVLITLKPWSIELSLALFILLLAVSFVILYFVIRTLVRLWRSPRALNRWHTNRSQNKARKLQVNGIMRVIEGDWQQAERLLLSHLSQTDTPSLNYLGAAHAAQGRGDYKKRDHYLAQAIDSDPDQATAIGLTQANLQFRSGQYEQAGETLRRLRSRTPKNKRVLGLSLKVLEQTKDWRTLQDILPTARKQKAAPMTELERLQQLANRQLLAHSTKSAELQRQWRSMSREDRNNPVLLATYAERLMNEGAHKEVEELLRKSVNRRWDPRLARLYGHVQAPDPALQLKRAEEWAAAHKDSPELMLSLAQISLNNELWGKARSYLEACISLGGTVEAYRELGHLLEQLDEKEKALDLYRRGIEQAAPQADAAGRPPTAEDGGEELQSSSSGR